jgi:high-affinity Fe2+/Pb2+ permease
MRQPHPAIAYPVAMIYGVLVAAMLGVFMLWYCPRSLWREGNRWGAVLVAAFLLCGFLSLARFVLLGNEP